LRFHLNRQTPGYPAGTACKNLASWPQNRLIGILVWRVSCWASGCGFRQEKNLFSALFSGRGISPSFLYPKGPSIGSLSNYILIYLIYAGGWPVAGLPDRWWQVRKVVPTIGTHPGRILMPRDHPRRRGGLRKVIPTVATFGSPPDQTEAPVIRPSPRRSPIPAICPHLELPVDLICRSRVARIS